jgi:hypothetical protein
MRSDAVNGKEKDLPAVAIGHSSITKDRGQALRFPTHPFSVKQGDLTKVSAPTAHSRHSDVVVDVTLIVEVVIEVVDEMLTSWLSK